MVRLRNLVACFLVLMTLPLFNAAAKTSSKVAAKKQTGKKAGKARQKQTSHSRSTAKTTLRRVSSSRVKKGSSKGRTPRTTILVRTSAETRATSLAFVQEHISEPSGDWIEQPEALDSFFSHLYSIESNPNSGSVHALHFGDSHTAADEFTGQMRTLLQQKFGNGGAGYSYAGYPFAGCRIHGTRRAQSSGWTTIGNHFRDPNDGLLGLGGLVIETAREGQTATLDAPYTHAELQYLQQPEGGSINLYEDDRLLTTISTKGSGPGIFTFDSPAGDHHLQLQTADSSPVRLLGWVTENGTGVTYEALGINGAEAALILKWNEDVQSKYLQGRAPALIVLDYGTNEASNKNWTYEAYSEMFRTVIERLRKAAPEASVLVLGPPDRYIMTRSGKRRVWTKFEGTDHIIKAQRDVCIALDCAFWDKRERMGGLGSMQQWVNVQWAQADHTHFTSVGYHELANALFSDIMQRYQIYKEQRSVLDGSKVNGERATNP